MHDMTDDATDRGLLGHGKMVRDTKLAKLSDVAMVIEDDDQDEVCWICLQQEWTRFDTGNEPAPSTKAGLEYDCAKEVDNVRSLRPAGEPQLVNVNVNGEHIDVKHAHRLVRACNCPHLVHLECLGYWQLRSAGKRQERTCDWCKQELPDWRLFLSDMIVSDAARLSPSTALPPLDTTSTSLYINFKGIRKSFPATASPAGFSHFTTHVRETFAISGKDTIDWSFQCIDPFTRQQIVLTGEGSFNAAIFCSAVASWRCAITNQQQMQQKALPPARQQALVLDQPVLTTAPASMPVARHADQRCLMPCVTS
eukprot:jgi/Mesvir1/17918/Mv12981-RA.1